MLNDGEFQSEQIGSFFSFAKASDEFGVSLIGQARIPKRSAQLCETILCMYEAGTLSFSFEIMASDVSERDGVMVIDAAEGNELIGMAIVSVPAYPEATALQLVAERQEEHEMDETVKKLAETEARLNEANYTLPTGKYVRMKRLLPGEQVSMTVESTLYAALAVGDAVQPAAGGTIAKVTTTTGGSD